MSELHLSACLFSTCLVSLRSLFKNKAGLWDHSAVCVNVSPYQALNF
jgi:hypothetical protein